DRANQFVEHNAPWVLRKDPDKVDQLRDVCTIGLNLFRQLAIYLAPVLPSLAQQTGELLGDPITDWSQSQTPLVGTSVNKFKHLMQRVDRKKVDKMVAASTEAETETGASASATEDSGEALAAEPLEAQMTIDDFVKVDLRVARVVAAEDVPEANKLLRLTLSLGGDNQRTVFAGIKSVYKPEDLVGRLLICAANLAPRKMKFGMSEGMVLAAGAGGKEIFLLSPDDGAKPGQRVH
ncbi:MAG TPA: methionine--tRNA ligase subunit beta, partial [Thermoguttaceae bacterium]|nr:methionine--tRNA ligase subunit beta [Thermoguttaceae bacterium]